ncbi:MAG: chaperone modulator CbpM [Pseudomonadota bacterium]
MGEILSGVPLDEQALSLDELAHACGVAPDWIVRHVEAGLLHAGARARAGSADWRFASAELARARRLLRVERDFEADDELAALVVDLSEEVRRLKVRLHGARGA